MGRILRILSSCLAVAIVVGGAAPVVAGDDDVTRIKFDVTLTSQQTALHEVGGGGDTTYGWNELTGAAETSSGEVHVQMLGNVEYVDGSGDFFGFVTLEFASLSMLGLRMNGEATVRDDGSTALAAKLRVIGGNAAMTGVTGKGKFTGERPQELGGAIEITISLRLRGLDA
jgi:hypothetical protein